MVLTKLQASMKGWKFQSLCERTSLCLIWNVLRFCIFTSIIKKKCNVTFSPGLNWKYCMFSNAVRGYNSNKKQTLFSYVMKGTVHSKRNKDDEGWRNSLRIPCILLLAVMRQKKHSHVTDRCTLIRLRPNRKIVV